MKTNKQNIDKIHKKDLGFELPDNYFEKSKNEILLKTSTKKEGKLVSLYKRKIIWFAAAGIALIFAVKVYKEQSIDSIKNIPTFVLDSLNLNENMDLAADYFVEEDILIASLFVSDQNVENYVNNAFINDIVADEYLDDYIVDELMTEDLY
jgi:hypothetical protein